MSTASKKAPFGMTFGSFFGPFLEAPKKTQKNRHKRSRLETRAPKWPPKCSPGLPKRRPKSIKKHPEIVCEPPWAPIGCKRYPPPLQKFQKHTQIPSKISKQTCFLAWIWTEYSCLILLQNFKKNAQRSACISIFVGTGFAGRVPAVHA